MTNTPQPSSPVSPTKDKRVLLVFVLPLVSCMCSSVVGIVIGQIGNFLYTILGQAAGCLSVPGFIGLFLITFGLSFLSNKMLRKWLSRKG